MKKFIFILWVFLISGEFGHILAKPHRSTMQYLAHDTAIEVDSLLSAEESAMIAYQDSVIVEFHKEMKQQQDSALRILIKELK